MCTWPNMTNQKSINLKIRSEYKHVINICEKGIFVNKFNFSNTS